MKCLHKLMRGNDFRMFILFAIINIMMYYIWRLNLDMDDKILLALSHVKSKDLKYILLWTQPHKSPFKYLKSGQETFMQRNCPAQNCYVAVNETYFYNVTDFDAVLFHVPDINKKYIKYPKQRSGYQKYVFVSMESSHYYPICNGRYDDLFNWTWTYKLNSDLNYAYMVIRNRENEIIGPRKVMHWISVNDMEPIGEDIKAKLMNKKMAAAWFVSNCDTLSKRQNVVMQLQEEMAIYNMTLDIYGRCGTKACPLTEMNHCLQMIERYYYFYLSFENSFSEDYVTEKLLHALKYYAVPVVFGGANYTRFMPTGIYLDANKLTIAELASEMYILISIKEKYYDYFKWHNHYSYHDASETPETDYYCRLCEALNNDTLVNEVSVYEDLREWWNPAAKRSC